MTSNTQMAAAVEESVFHVTSISTAFDHKWDARRKTEDRQYMFLYHLQVKELKPICLQEMIKTRHH